MRKLRAFGHAEQSWDVSRTCLYFGISRDSFCRSKKEYPERGQDAFIISKPRPKNFALRTPPEIEKKVIYLGKRYNLRQVRIAWYLERYDDVKILAGGVYCVLKGNALNRLPENAKRRRDQISR